MEKSQILREAHGLITSGQKPQAIQILEQHLAVNPADSEAYALLSLAFDDPEKRRECLNAILRLSSDERALTWARRQLSALPIAEPMADLFQGNPAPADSPRAASKPQLASRKSSAPPRLDLYLILAGVAAIAVVVIGGVIALPLLRQRLAAPAGPATPAIQASQPARPTPFLFATSTSTLAPTTAPSRTPTDRPTVTPTDSPTFTPGPTATPTDAEAHFEKGYTLYRHLWNDKALVEFNAALSLDPNLVSVYVVRARLYMFDGQRDKANADLAKAQSLAPDDVDVLLLPGTLSWIVGDYSAALAVFNRVVARFPDSYSAYNWRGRAYSALGDDQKALADATTAVRLNPADFDSMGDISIILYDNHQYAESCDWDQKALAIDPDHPILHTHYADCLLWGFADLEGASAQYEEALKLYPEMMEGHYGRAMIFYYKRQYSQALPEYNTAERLGALKTAIYWQRGLTYSHLGRYQNAVTDFTNLLPLQNTACVYNNRCQAYNGIGNYKAAIDDCTIAIEAGGPVKAYFNRAVAYDQRGDKANALSDYEVFLSYYKADSEETTYALERVQALGGGTAQPDLMCLGLPGGACAISAAELAPPPDLAAFPHVMCES